jgi:hypothetical protein
MDINWLFAQYVMRNTILSLKSLMSYLLSAIIAFPGNICKQVEWIGWVGHSIGFPLVETGWTGIKTGWTGFDHLRVRAVSQRCSQRRQSRRLRCQSARKSVQSFSARFYCTVWPETGWTGFITGWTGFLSADQPAPPLFLSPSPLLFFSVPFFSRRRLLFFFSLLHTFSTQKPTCAIQSLEVFVGDQFISAFSIISLDLVEISWFKLQIEVLPYFISLYSILPVLDYLVYHPLGTF